MHDDSIIYKTETTQWNAVEPGGADNVFKHLPEQRWNSAFVDITQLTWQDSALLKQNIQLWTQKRTNFDLLHFIIQWIASQYNMSTTVQWYIHPWTQNHTNFNEVTFKKLLHFKWTWHYIIEPQHDKTNKVACAPSKDADQTGRMPRLIWVFAGRTLILLVLSCRGSYVIPPCDQTLVLEIYRVQYMTHGCTTSSSSWGFLTCIATKPGHLTSLQWNVHHSVYWRY